MSHDVRDQLRGAARPPTVPVDPDAIHARGRRRRVRARVGAAAAVLALVTGAVTVGALGGGRPAAPYVEDRPATPSPTTSEVPTAGATPSSAGSPGAGTAAPVPTVEVADLDRVVAVARDDATRGGHIEMHSPDGTTTSVPLGTDTPSTGTWFPDRTGGVVWQDASPVVHATVEGERTLLEPGEAEGLHLVGMRDDGGWALVERRTGTTPDDTTGDLLALPLDGSAPETLMTDLTGWESGVLHAAALELGLYAISAGASQFLVVDRPDTDHLAPVLEVGESAGEYIEGVAMGAGLDGLALVESHPGHPASPEARLVRVDMEHATILEGIPVPLQAGVGDVPVVARTLSAGGDLVVVSRQTVEDQRWVQPLVLDRTTGGWSELALTGQVRVGPRPMPEEPPPPPCQTEDAALADAAPTADRLHVYLPCTGAGTLDVVHRHDVAVPPTGDVAADARTALEALLSSPDPALAARGYAGYGDVGIGVHDVRFSAGELTVDLDFPEDGIGNLGASSAGMTWHRSLLGTLLQFPSVDTVRLLEDGSCEAYTMSFEGAGCFTADRSQAPWSPGP